jgi:hypothetical protein
MADQPVIDYFFRPEESLAVPHLVLGHNAVQYKFPVFNKEYKDV